MKYCGIYKITNIVNNKKIIGQSTNIHKRWILYRHWLRKGSYNNPYLQHAWNKYGEKKFKFEIIFLCSSEELNEAEIRFIEQYKSIDSEYGYNLKTGGNRPIMSEETKQRMSVAKMGQKNSFYGKRHSSQTKQKIREVRENYKGINHPLFGKHLSLQTKQKIREKHLGKKHSSETIRKMKKNNSGKSNPMFGRRHSEETKRKIGLKSKLKFMKH